MVMRAPEDLAGSYIWVSSRPSFMCLIKVTLLACVQICPSGGALPPPRYCPLHLLATRRMNRRSQLENDII